MTGHTIVMQKETLTEKNFQSVNFAYIDDDVDSQESEPEKCDGNVVIGSGNCEGNVPSQNHKAAQNEGSNNKLGKIRATIGNTANSVHNQQHAFPTMVNPNNSNQICDNKNKSEFSIDVHNNIQIASNITTNKELKNNTGIIDEMESKDPYSELEMYLEKIKNEISEVFEQLKVEEEISNEENQNASISTEDIINNIYSEEPDKKIQSKYLTSAHDENSINVGNGTQLPDKKAQTKITSNNNNSISSNKEFNDWNCMENFDNLIEIEIKKLISNNNTNNSTSNKKETSISPSASAVSSFTSKKNKVDNDNNNNILKLEKHVSIPLQSFKSPGLLLNGSRRSSPKQSRSRTAFLDNLDPNESLEKIQTNTRCLSNLVLRESRLRDSSDILDEDEDSRSLSSSAYEESTNFSSTKSINSLNSTNVTDSSNDSRACKTEPSDKRRPSGETDSLDVLSLCDAAEFENDDVSELSSNLRNFDSPNSLKSNYSSEHDTVNSLDGVELRKKFKTLNGSSKRKEKGHSCPFGNNGHLKNNQFSHSLPLTKRNAKTTNFPQEAPNLKILTIPLEQVPFTDIVDLPSPSSTSLNSGKNFVLELGTKSNSAPMLIKNNFIRDDFNCQNTLRCSRSQSDRYLAEIQAVESVEWLRQAGFPQYAQMYEDMQFPIDLSSVAKDHPFLDKDPLQSLYRRLQTLNRCATMRLNSVPKRTVNKRDDSDDDFHTLSENWTFQPEIRRWSRMGDIGLPPGGLLAMANIAAANSNNKDDDKSSNASRESSSERLENEELSVNSTEQDTMQVKFRRTGSERIKDGAKAILKRVESIKARRRKRQNRDGVVISGPHTLDLSHLNHKLKDNKYGDISCSRSNPTSPGVSKNPIFFINDSKYPDSKSSTLMVPSPIHLSPAHHSKKPNQRPKKYQPNRTSPLHIFNSHKEDDSSSYCSEASQESSSGSKKKIHRFLHRHKKEDKGALSDSECQQISKSKKKNKSNRDFLKAPDAEGSKFKRGGSLNLGKESKKYRENLQKRRSFRSTSAERKTEKTTDSDKDDDIILRSTRTPVRWHSFQNPERTESINIRISTPKKEFLEGMSMNAMSCGQLQVIRKLALVTLTGYMERYIPSHRTGWNWELPKFIKKIKAPDYKDKKVFGVPFVISLQRTGHALPKGIQIAFKWLKYNGTDQIGLFRKSGVKSRIMKLKSLIEINNDESLIAFFDDQQAYDVADVVKLYFRELPESLLTAKLSETFVAIFEHLPATSRFDALQSAFLLLPDEHREVLFTLLEFLNDVTEKESLNQMTAKNLAVCFAPSIFQNEYGGSRTSTPRKKPLGLPDHKDLLKTKASHECLTYMIQNYKSLFHISSEKISRCNFGYMEESKPVTLDSLGDGNWSGYIYECIKATIKESRERTRGWISFNTSDSNVEISYKKVNDGHSLRLWKCVTEIEATPEQILDIILNKRKCWDSQLLKMKILDKLDEKSEVIQYAKTGPSVYYTDYCALRSYCTGLGKGGSICIVECSVEHSKSSVLLNSNRGIILASRYLIEPIGGGSTKSRLMHLSRIDERGRCPEWYNKNYGYICSQYLTKIRNFFK